MEKKTVLLILASLVLIGGGFAGYKFFYAPAEAKAPEPMIVNAGEFVTNLDGGDKRFIKIQIDVKCESETTAKELLAKSSQMRDQVLAVLRSKTTSDLSGPEGMQKLSRDLMKKIDPILSTGKTLDIYFTDFAIQ